MGGDLNSCESWRGVVCGENISALARKEDLFYPKKEEGGNLSASGAVQICAGPIITRSFHKQQGCR